MRTYRCLNPHPSRPGQLCDMKLLKVEGPLTMGLIEVFCKKHKGLVWVDTRENYTSSTAITVDRQFARV